MTFGFENRNVNRALVAKKREGGRGDQADRDKEKRPHSKESAQAWNKLGDHCSTSYCLNVSSGGFLFSIFHLSVFLTHLYIKMPHYRKKCKPTNWICTFFGVHIPVTPLAHGLLDSRSYCVVPMVLMADEESALLQYFLCGLRFR